MYIILEKVGDSWWIVKKEDRSGEDLTFDSKEEAEKWAKENCQGRIGDQFGWIIEEVW